MSKQEGNDKKRISAFLLKLYKLLEDPSNDEIVSWSNCGKSFVIKNVHKFSSEVLPSYFKHKNIQSFVRQLHMYNFHKTRELDYDNVFSHAYFYKGGMNSLSQIKRQRKNCKNNNSKSIDSVTLLFDQASASKQITKKNFKSIINILMSKITDMKEKQRTLEESSSLWVEQNKELLSQNEFLLKEMKNKMDYNKKLDIFILFIFEIICLKTNTTMNYGSTLGYKDEVLNSKQLLSNSSSVITEEIINYLKNNTNYETQYSDGLIKNLVDNYLENVTAKPEKKYLENPTIKEIKSEDRINFYQNMNQNRNNNLPMLTANDKRSPAVSFVEDNHDLSSLRSANYNNMFTCNNNYNDGGNCLINNGLHRINSNPGHNSHANNENSIGILQKQNSNNIFNDIGMEKSFNGNFDQHSFNDGVFSHKENNYSLTPKTKQSFDLNDFFRTHSIENLAQIDVDQLSSVDKYEKGIDK